MCVAVSPFRNKAGSPKPMSNTLHRIVAASLLGGALLTVIACGAGQLQVPPARRLVIYSGARIAPPQERMDEVYHWVSEQWDSISRDPGFWIETTPTEGPVYPWEELELTLNPQQDTAIITYQGPPGMNLPARRAFVIYAHLHLMAALDRLDRWLPDAVGSDEFETEKAILARTAESWLFQRSVLDAPPNGILDELMFVAENGYLDAFVLIARPGEFVEARREWLAANPDRTDAYVEWFRETFERDPPGLRGGSSGG